MQGRIRARMRVSGSPGKLAARITTALRALASRLTAVLARSLSVQTWAAVNATNKPKRIPSGGNIPGEKALNERARAEPDFCDMYARARVMGSYIGTGRADLRHPALRLALGAHR